MQESFLRLWERWHEIERIDDPTAYLFRVAMNAFRSRRRRAAARSGSSCRPVKSATRSSMRRCVRMCGSSCSTARRASELLSCSSTCSGIRPSRQRASWACVPRRFGPSPRRVAERSEERKERGMPDVQEVFRLATNKVKPDPDALERQLRRQRKAARSRAEPRLHRGRRGARVIWGRGVRDPQRSRTARKASPGSTGRVTGPSSLSFVTTLPLGATRKRPRSWI